MNAVNLLYGFACTPTSSTMVIPPVIDQIQMITDKGRTTSDNQFGDYYFYLLML